MQCRVPRPQTRSTAWMPMTSRSGKQSARMSEGDAVVGIVEGGDEDEPVGDVEVGVAGGEALALRKTTGAGRGSSTMVNCLPFEGAGSFEGGARFSASGSWFGSLVLGSTQVRIVDGPTKRVMSSTWPWVSSPAHSLARARSPGRCRGNRGTPAQAARGSRRDCAAALR